MKDKISKIDKLENSHKAQAIIKEAQSASVATKSANPQKKKPAKSTFAKPTPKNNAPLKPKATQKKAEKAGKKALKNAQKASAKSGQKSLTLGVITISADTKKLAKISAFFNNFITNAEEKSEFVKKALLAQIKKHKRKHK